MIVRNLEVVGVYLVLFSLLCAGTALAQANAGWSWEPEPGGTLLNPSVKGDEGAEVSYTVEATDRDTNTFVIPNSVQGDDLVEIHTQFQNSTGTQMLVVGTQTGFDPGVSRRRRTYTVRLRAANRAQGLEGGEWTQSEIDQYLCSDSRNRLNDQRAEGYPGPEGTHIGTLLQQTVIIVRKRGKMMGRITDSATGFPLGADIWVDAVAEEYPVEFPEVTQVSSNGYTGEYEMEYFATEHGFRVEASGYQPEYRTVSIPRDGVTIQDFALNY